MILRPLQLMFLDVASVFLCLPLQGMFPAHGYFNSADCTFSILLFDFWTLFPPLLVYGYLRKKIVLRSFFLQRIMVLFLYIHINYNVLFHIIFVTGLNSASLSLYIWNSRSLNSFLNMAHFSADVERLKKLILHNPYILTLPEVGDVKDDIIPKNVQQFYVRISMPGLINCHRFILLQIFYGLNILYSFGLDKFFKYYLQPFVHYRYTGITYTTKVITLTR